MSFRTIICFVFCSLFLLPACDNDFELTAPWQPIPVVYGLINPADTAHYIRVEKAFLDPKIDAATIASNPDSLYFDNVKVEIARSGSAEATYVLEEVDGNLEGFVRDTGVFANAPNILYKLKLPNNERLGFGDILNLKITIDELSEPITATTTVVGEYELAKPSIQAMIREIGFLPGNKAQVDWRDDEETSFLFDIVYHVHYRERLSDDQPFENKELVWNIITGKGTENRTSFIRHEFDSDEFYTFLAQSIDPVESAIRRMDSINIEIFGAGIEVFDLIRIGKANSGITSSQVIPNFTNLSSGRGIFSSKGYLFETGFKVSNQTKDSLENNQFTEELNFR